MRIIDSHAHYDDAAFDIDRYELLDVLFAGGICKLINVGCSVKSSYSSAELAERYPNIYASAGLHPDAADEIDRLDEIKALCSRKKVVAVGEIGLDYHYENHSRELQKRAFEEQLRLAAEVRLPVIIHSRDAWEDTMDILRKYRPKGVMHCFSGSAEIAEEIVKMGMYVGFTGVVTFKNAKKALRALEAVPLDRLLVETDCPYMSPEPNRGKRNFSGNLPYTIAAMAAAKGISPEEAAEITAENAERLFNI
ncbi:MAG: TatD family hydrolase [Oscillospiraceae bacterium]|nr:TatD family hydrolase [Oscillospiraceae bacterium]